MKSKIIGLAALLASALSMSTTANANGYWEYIEVCDYENVTIQVPKTQCQYNGRLWGPINATPSSIFHQSFGVIDGHVSCPASMYDQKTEFQNGNWVTYTGWLSLTGTNHFNDTRTERRQVPGSCRLEEVWIELCPTCEIP